MLYLLYTAVPSLNRFPVTEAQFWLIWIPDRCPWLADALGHRMVPSGD